MKFKILIVDDEHGIVDMIQSYFQKQYDILTAYSGQEALQKISSNPDLILLDIRQPHLYPTQNLTVSLALCAHGHDVTDSIIDGKLVMKDRQVLTLDEEQVMAEAQVHMAQCVRRAGI